MADVYPNEAYPSDATVVALDGITDQATGLVYLAKGIGPASQPSYEIQYNRRQQRANRRLALVTEGLVVDEGSLNIGVYPFNYALGGLHKRFAGATAQSVPDDATRYVYVDAANTVQIGSAYPADISTFVPLAKVTTASGSLTLSPEIGHAGISVPGLMPRIAVAVGTEAGDTIRVTLQLEDQAANTVARRWFCELWLGDATFGDLATTAPTGGLSVVTGQQLGAHLVTDKHLKAIATAGGTIEIDIADSGTPTFYVMAVGGGADVVAGSAVTFAA